MKAAVFREVNKPMEVEEVQISKPGPREVLVRSHAVGVCHSDLHFFNGTYPGPVADHPRPRSGGRGRTGRVRR